jgi:flagellar biosynthesis/type III secretory pathway protein FliH
VDRAKASALLGQILARYAPDDEDWYAQGYSDGHEEGYQEGYNDRDFQARIADSTPEEELSVPSRSKRLQMLMQWTTGRSAST